eukprot:s573_g24.t1
MQDVGGRNLSKCSGKALGPSSPGGFWDVPEHRNSGTGPGNAESTTGVGGRAACRACGRQRGWAPLKCEETKPPQTEQRCGLMAVWELQPGAPGALAGQPGTGQKSRAALAPPPKGHRSRSEGPTPLATGCWSPPGPGWLASPTRTARKPQQRRNAGGVPNRHADASVDLAGAAWDRLCPHQTKPAPVPVQAGVGRTALQQGDQAALLAARPVAPDRAAKPPVGATG